MKNYIQSGEIITVTADRDVTSGEFYAVGNLVGFAKTDALEGQDFAITTTGVYRVNVATAPGMKVGDLIYLDGQTLTATEDEDLAAVGVIVSVGTAFGAETEIHFRLNA